MENSFLKAVKSENNWKKTENYANALKSTLDPVLDLFGTVGSLRSRSREEIENLFTLAYRENPLLALKISFYARDIRNGGLGERRTSRIIWNWLARFHPEVIVKNLEYIPYFGRWDDIYTFVGTKVEAEAFKVVNKQMYNDIQACTGRTKGIVSLLAKWLKSENTSSVTSRKLAKVTMEHLSLSPREYRKTLSMLRKHLDVVETKMSSKRWKEIRYRTVPSRAMMIYRRAFAKHDPEGWSEYITKVEKGEEEIKASTLFPYDIFRAAGFSFMRPPGSWKNPEVATFTSLDKTLELQWNALPNYLKEINEEDQNCLVMADTSGSMMTMDGLPMYISVSLAVYFAERNIGPFKNVFITFSSTPEFCEIKGSNLTEKVAGIKSIVATTDIEAAFKLILDAAKKHNISPKEMPKAILIISDMEFNMASRNDKMTYYDHFKEMYKEAGYQIPNIVFWNVAARHYTFHASNIKGVQLASGASPSVFRSILLNMNMTPVDAMLRTLLAPTYEMITL